MLNIAFFDGCGWDYTPATPYVRPLGGSQSALCYLSAALAKRGHRVTFFGGMTQFEVAEGVSCIPLAVKPRAAIRRPFDAMIVLNGPADLGPQLRPCLHPDTPLVLWTQHAADQPAMQPLERESIRSAWDHIICVSDWHRRTMIEKYGLDPAKVSVRRNAIGPAFEGMFASQEELKWAKGGHPRLAYTSTPFRGLDVLLDVFPTVRKDAPGPRTQALREVPADGPFPIIHLGFPDARLKVYSDMKVYQIVGWDEYEVLYERCRTTEGVEYVGSLPQAELAKELRSASMLAYPCAFEETSCIAVMEAMAAGLEVVTSNLGALPETTMAFGSIVPCHPDRRQFAKVYEFVLRECMAGRWSSSDGLWDQVRTVNRECTWPVRAAEWEAAIPTWKHAEAVASA